MGQALGQASHLDVEHLVAMIIQVLPLWHEGQRSEMARKLTLTFSNRSRMHMGCLGEEVGLRGSKGRIATTLHTQLVEVYLRAHKLGIEAEALAMSYHRAILCYQGIARKH